MGRTLLGEQAPALRHQLVHRGHQRLGQPARGEAIPLRRERRQLDSGATAQLPVPLPDEDSRLLGHGLSATGQRGPNKEQLAYARDGKILWKQPYEKAFATEYSSDSGWTWTLASEPSDTLVGSGSRAHNQASSGTYLLDLASDYMSIGVDAASGTVLWRQPGAEAYCQGIFTDWVTDARRTVVLCAIDSGMSSILESDSDTRQSVLTGLKWRVTALDARTGAEQWSHGLPAGAEAHPGGDQTAGTDPVRHRTRHPAAAPGVARH
ncbi:hypothetical protein [Glutamicibacter creatinolyticus]|uniref:hypothetical protein n=1 Tax=Glutamicibacter creatinolyticus TaxID=162496 RepID=UPI0031DAE3FF